MPRGAVSVLPPRPASRRHGRRPVGRPGDAASPWSGSWMLRALRRQWECHRRHEVRHCSATGGSQGRAQTGRLLLPRGDRANAADRPLGAHLGPRVAATHAGPTQAMAAVVRARRAAGEALALGTADARRHRAHGGCLLPQARAAVRLVPGLRVRRGGDPGRPTPSAAGLGRDLGGPRRPHAVRGRLGKGAAWAHVLLGRLRGWLRSPLESCRSGRVLVVRPGPREMAL